MTYLDIPGSWPEPADVADDGEETTGKRAKPLTLKELDQRWALDEAIEKKERRTKMSKEIMGAFTADAGKVLAKLREVAEDEAAERDGYNPRMTAAKRSEMRAGLRAIWDKLESGTLDGLKAWLESSRAEAVKARVEAGEGLGTQERIAAYMEADYLAKTNDAGDLLGQARQALARGDAVGASVRLRAARLASTGSRPPQGIGEVVNAVEAALDESVPGRRAAVEALRADTRAYADGFTAVLKSRSEAMGLLGDAPASALASVGAKVSAAKTAREAGS